MASIVIVSGPNEGDYYPLGKRTVVIGRGENCPVQVVDDRVSRKHVQIRHENTDGAYHALDMRSANGVYINGRKIEDETPLRDGDVIEVGNSKISFSDQEFPDRESAMSHYKQRGERDRYTMRQ